MTFINNHIDKEQLPSIEEIEYNALDKKYLTIMRIQTIITTLILSAIISIFYLSEEGFPLSDYLYIIGGILLLATIKFFYASISYKYRGYALREKDIIYKKGYIWRSITTVPFNRIQHTEIKESAIARLFSLQTVKFYTAGGATSDLKINGLKTNDALRIKEFVNGKLESYEE